MLLRRFLLVMAVIFFAALIFLSGYATYPLLHQGAAPPLTAAGASAAQAGDMGQFWQVWSLLDRDFYGPQPDAQTRTRGAIAGMVQTFGDPYTFWVEPQTRELERDDLAGRFGGIGATVEQTATVFVLHPLPDQPAARAGILDGDRLVSVDGQPITTTLDVNAVVTLIRGPVGTPVALVVSRGELGAAQELTFTVERAEIRTPSVEWRLLDDDPATAAIGYLRQTLFSARSAEEMEQGIAELRAASATRFIWDLRGNPGGLLDAAVSQADMWLEQGLIVREEKAGGITNSFEATPGDLTAGAPLVVLVDGASASASEIVAGALQAHGRARVAGAKTFGKGSVQLIHELGDQSSLHVTNGQWLTPAGQQISGKGLAPDVVVAESEDALQVAVDLLLDQPVAPAEDSK
jgi:carboxyl-terminal processing protease